MKKKFVFLLVLTTLIFESAIAQKPTQPTITTGWGNLDYSVPESPAGKILGGTNSTIIRPSSVREIAVSASNYFFDNGPSLPKNFAVEIAPALLSRRLSLQKYNSNKFWYRSKVSLGTSTSDGGTFNMAVGLNFTIIDKTDLRADQDFLKLLLDITEANVKLNDLIRGKIEKEEGSLSLSQIDDALENVNDPNHNRLVARAEELAIDLADSSIFESLPKIEAVRRTFKERNWNKKIVQVALSAMFPSRDSLVRNLESLSNAGFWFSAGYPAGKNGQIMFGAKALGIETDEGKLQQWDFALASRYYYGSNKVKGFLEIEGKVPDSEFNNFAYFVGLGGELNLINGLWLDFSFGLSKPNGEKTQFTPSINLKFASPERK